jgi:hypothetical protein
MSDKPSFAIFDFGLFCSLAELLARRGCEVGYFCPWETSFCDGRELLIGEGLEGVTRIKYWDNVVDSYQHLLFPDCHCGDLQAYYRRKGYKVWGSGKGAELELLRWKTKERLEQAGLPVNECYRLKGTAALRKFFQGKEQKDGWYVKVSGLRGIGETWFARNYLEAKGMIDDLDCKHGIRACLFWFIVEKAIPDAKEIGYDGLSIDGQFPDKSFYGAEIKDKSYFGVLSDYSELPEPLKKVNAVCAKVMNEQQYRNGFSSELRDEYCIDLTARHASPAGEVIYEAIDNLTEVITAGAEGRLVQPEWTHKYGAQIILCSEFAEEHSLPLSFPEEIRPWVKIYNHARVDDEGPIGLADYFEPQVAKMKQIGSVIALADDPTEAADLCKERAELVHAFDLESSPDSLDEAMEEMQELVSGEPN